ncbi:hypothetical protein PTTG_27873 [Puccinia triticina 1-1 BBBD Race 1]|uniref:Uncharacterized protein n=1 Tax=Puccinia triticina (isolate 1-1 / race 1 (BBBD)) TaxID=630390 RepID=A0A180GGQ2_PUCT1|nr:hypothetical protein PTTG_27873 [Puccinia triticina 1-1 BBBD Race 1]
MLPRGSARSDEVGLPSLSGGTADGWSGRVGPTRRAARRPARTARPKSDGRVRPPRDSLYKWSRGRGDEEVFDPIWCESHKNEKKFRKKTSNAYTLLELCMSADLYSVVQAADTFSEAMEELALACGEQSLIKLGDKIYSLIHLDFVPGTSIADHTSKFQSMYTSLKSAQISHPKTQIDTAMAGIFFLKSF